MKRWAEVDLSILKENVKIVFSAFMHDLSFPVFLIIAAIAIIAPAK
ncbi:MAG TPA: hypothetical protein GX704_02140 [Clostridiales bacterium]|jgi:hypothetical protein|nr:hypothetical protein [Clostridiales bacterium]